MNTGRRRVGPISNWTGSNARIASPAARTPPRVLPKNSSRAAYLTKQAAEGWRVGLLAARNTLPSLYREGASFERERRGRGQASKLIRNSSFVLPLQETATVTTAFLDHTKLLRNSAEGEGL